MGMTPEEAKAKQDELGKHYTLAWWYGVHCDPCCGVFPKFMTTGGSNDRCFYQCEVCGKRTALHDMPWQAEKAWNAGETYREKDVEHLTLF